MKPLPMPLALRRSGGSKIRSGAGWGGIDGQAAAVDDAAVVGDKLPISGVGAALAGESRRLGGVGEGLPRALGGGIEGIPLLGKLDHGVFLGGMCRGYKTPGTTP